MTTPANKGFEIHPGFIDRRGQEALVASLRSAVAAAPLFVPAMPRTGQPFSVRMTNLGPLGWVSDMDGGYRYQATHPETGATWPAIPAAILDIWRQLSGYPDLPEACLVNFYEAGSRMGLHQDRDEIDFPSRLSRSRSAMTAASASAALGGATRRDRCGYPPAILLFLAGRRAWPSTGSTEFTRARRICLPVGLLRADGLI